MNIKNTSYQGNTLLKKQGVQEGFTPDLIKEIIKCKNDPVYFICNYINIINLDKGLIKFNLYDYQEEIIKLIDKEKRIVLKSPRQSGKCGRSTTKINIGIEDNEEEMTIKELFDKF